MRNAFGAMGLLCGAIVVALVGRYGFSTTDDPADAWIIAFLFGVIATFGLAGHAFAVFLWRHSRLLSVIAGIVAVAALGLNLSNSLGAIAGRADTVAQDRIDKNRKIRAAEAELTRLTSLREAMGSFAPADDAAVSAAQRAADAAASQRKAECEQRGKPAGECRKREDAERYANMHLAAVSAAKAATDRAAEIETATQTQRAKLADLGPVVKVSAQGSVMASLFRLPDEEAGFLAAAQQFSTAAIVEFIILICLAGWEVSRPPPRNVEKRQESPSICPLTPVPVGDPRDPAEEADHFARTTFRPKRSGRVKLADMKPAYHGWCRDHGREPLSDTDIGRALNALFASVNLYKRGDGDDAAIVGIDWKDGQERLQIAGRQATEGV